eukprot:m.58561 g.58561  ORF g.58561 m.58561 type:complete len:115 (-) comp11702_c1_seq1:167-511(-)
MIIMTNRGMSPVFAKAQAAINMPRIALGLQVNQATKAATTSDIHVAPICQSNKGHAISNVSSVNVFATDEPIIAGSRTIVDILDITMRPFCVSKPVAYTTQRTHTHACTQRSKQ